MSDRTPSASEVQTTSQTPNPESQLPISAATAAPAEQSVPSPEVTAPVVDQAAVESAAEQAAAQVKAAREAADKLRVKAVAAYRKGDAAYAAGLLESGRLCGEYIAARLSISSTQGERKAAVDVLTLELSLVDGSTVDVNRLVRTYHATRLLPQGKAKHQATAYRTYREQWSRLLERQNGLAGEDYVLLPGMEQQVKAAFAKAVSDELSAAGVKAVVDELYGQHAKLLAEREAAALETAKASRIAEAAKLNAAAEELRKAEVAKQAAEAAAKGKSDAETTAAVTAAAVELEAKQRAAVEQQAKLEQAEREQKAAEKRAAEEKARLEKQAAKAAEKAKQSQQPATLVKDDGKAPANPTDQRGTVQGNLLRIAEVGTPKDVAGMILDLLTGAGKQAPAVLRLVAASLRWSKALATELVEGMADNRVDPGKAESALEALAEKAAEYVGEGIGEEETPAGPSPVQLAAALGNGQAAVA